MSALLKNRIVVAVLAALAGIAVSALRDAGVPVECPELPVPAPVMAPVMADGAAP